MICPKCGNKIYKDDVSCPYCKTTVEEIMRASNVEAKKAFKEKRKEDIVLSSIRPYDVSKKKLLLFAIFLGWTGAHCFYVGRMGRGFTIVVCIVLALCCVAIPQTWALHAYVSGLVAGTFGFIWLFTWWIDIVNICFNKFKIPVVLKKKYEE